MFPDTEYYFNIAKLPFTVKSFFFGLRPFGITAFFKLVGFDVRQIVLTFYLIYFISWSYLFYVLVHDIEPLPLAIVSAGIAAYLAAYPDFAMWAATILTETLSISLTVLSTAALIRLFRTHRLRYFVYLVICVVVNITLRDFNAYYSLLLLALIPFLLLRRAITIRAAAVGFVILLGSYIYAQLSATHAGDKMTDARWFFGIMAHVGSRILPNPEYTAFFTERGMPLTPALVRLTGKMPGEEDWAFYLDPELEGFRIWVREHGPKVYGSFILHHLPYVFDLLVKWREEIFQLHYFMVGYYKPDGYRLDIPPRVDFRFLYILNAALLLYGVLYSLHRTSRRKIAVAATYAGFVIAALPLAIVSILAGGDMEVARHSLPVSLQTALAIPFGLFCIAELHRDPKE
jgi:hypothetical protein